MSATKRRAVRPNLGNPLRPRTETRRDHFLVTDVTEEEQQEILQYCLRNKISVSQFLADLVLQDASRPKPDRKQKVTVKAEFELSPEEYEKLELLTRLYKKQNIGELIRDLIKPNLDFQRLHAPAETTSLRYYLSAEEHGRVTKHIAGTGISARNYAAMLALKAMARDRKKPK